MYPLLLRGPACIFTICVSDTPETEGTQHGLVLRAVRLVAAGAETLVVSTLQQLKALQLQHMAAIRNPGWQGLFICCGCRAAGRRAASHSCCCCLRSMHRTLSKLASRAARRQASSSAWRLRLLRCLVAHGVGQQTSLDDIAQSLLLPSTTWHLRQQGRLVVTADIDSGTAQVLYEEAEPRPAALLGRLRTVGTGHPVCKPGVRRWPTFGCLIETEISVSSRHPKVGECHDFRPAHPGHAGMPHLLQW